MSDSKGAVNKAAEDAKTHRDEEIDEAVLEEGSFYLSKLGLDAEAIAERFEIPRADVIRHKTRFERKLNRGEALEVSSDLAFWGSVKQEAEGNVKVTFVTEKGFHHAWRSDLEKLDGPTLLSIFEECKTFLNLDPNSRFLQYSPPKNYDPLAMQREISKAVTVINSILETKGKSQDKRPSR
ncbi:MAG TPA: hypothetical protein VLY65_02740 [Nitrososphaerales archaeon]|nr:hypothetical protein [Nitrososphaerales archaeon]